MPNPEVVRPESRELVLSLLRNLKRHIDREESFRRLYKIYYSRIYHSFRGAQLSPEDRKDVTQDVFLRVYRGLEGCPEDVEGFERWLTTVARNAFRTWFQKTRRLKRSGLEVPLSDSSGEEGAPEVQDPRDPSGGAALEALLEEERARLLHRAIDEMPEQMRACVLLRVGQDRTYAEIARLLGLAEGTVKAHLHRARMWLRTALGSHFEDFDV